MNNGIVFKKAKGPFIIDTKGVKYFDLRYNSNITGYSPKEITKLVKNDISSRWNMKGETSAHRRIRSLFLRNFGKAYKLHAVLSLRSFFRELFASLQNEGMTASVSGERFALWLQSKDGVTHSAQKEAIIADSAEIFLRSKGDKGLFEKLIKSELSGFNIKIINHAWFPDADAPLFDADAVILPEFYSGNFDFYFLLLKDGSGISGILERISVKLNDIPYAYLSSSVYQYNLIRKNASNTILKMENDKIDQAGRLFAFKDVIPDRKTIEHLLSKKIILNDEPPYYGYIPLCAEAGQQKRIKEALNDI